MSKEAYRVKDEVITYNGSKAIIEKVVYEMEDNSETNKVYCYMVKIGETSENVLYPEEIVKVSKEDKFKTIRRLKSLNFKKKEHNFKKWFRKSELDKGGSKRTVEIELNTELARKILTMTGIKTSNLTDDEVFETVLDILTDYGVTSYNIKK